MMDAIEHKQVRVGDAVVVVTPDYTETFGLVIAVHDGQNGENAKQQELQAPLINVAIVSTDPAKHDSYGRQTDKQHTSLSHFNAVREMLPKVGRYWRNITAEDL